MSDKPTLQERITLGMRAETELVLARRAFGHIRTKLVDELLATPIEHAQQREYLYMAANLLPAVEEILVAFVNDAAAAQAEVNAAEILQAAAENRPARNRPN